MDQQGDGEEHDGPGERAHDAGQARDEQGLRLAGLRHHHVAAAADEGEAPDDQAPPAGIRGERDEKDQTLQGEEDAGTRPRAAAGEAAGDPRHGRGRGCDEREKHVEGGQEGKRHGPRRGGGPRGHDAQHDERGNGHGRAGHVPPERAVAPMEDGGERVFYASSNKGTISGVDQARKKKKHYMRNRSRMAGNK